MPILDSLGWQQPTEGSQGPPQTVDGYQAMEASPFRRCTGHCCRQFPVGGLALEDIQENLRRLENDGPWPQRVPRLGIRYQHLSGPILDVEILAHMLIELEPDKSSPHPDWPRFTCRHFDGVSCRIYNERPNMCRIYPSSTGCEHKSCTREHLGLDSE